MQKNWYIIYTKPKNEKKIEGLLLKRKIENYCPVNRRQVKNFKKSKLTLEPLFDSYVFVYLQENELSAVKEIDSVLSVLYWKGMPAIVSEDDIKAIKGFIFDHTDIKVYKTPVNSNIEEKNIDISSYKIDGNILMIKNRSFSKYLPSLGFTLIADIETEKDRGLEIAFGNSELRLQS